MKLAPYPKYKDSGVEWLGEVPEGWDTKRLKWIARLEYGSSLNEDDREGGDVPVYGSNGIVGEHSKSITGKPAIIIGRKGSYGKVSYSRVPCFPIDTTYYTDSSLTKENIRWLYYILSSIELDEITFDTGVPGLSREFAYAKTVPFSSKTEQTAIATFLDQKTTKIDELIKKNEKLIELLKEKRQAVISHAVTKGLNPNAKMKDSGIEWIGDIPEGWGVKKLKYVAEIVLGKMLQNEDSGKDELKPYMRAQNIQWEIVDITDVKEMWFSDYEIKKYRAQKGDLLISEGGEVGRTALWNGELEECYIQNSVHKVTVDKKLANNRYLLNLLKTYGKWGYFESIVNRVSIGHLTREKLKEIKIVCPPKNEQEQIVTYLDKKSSSMDEIIQKIQPQIEKLKEYRQALISNVVTGKVRVV